MALICCSMEGQRITDASGTSTNGESASITLPEGGLAYYDEITVDTTPPTVASIEPISNSALSGTDLQFLVTFSEAVQSVKPGRLRAFGIRDVGDHHRCIWRRK